MGAADEAEAEVERPSGNIDKGVIVLDDEFDLKRNKLASLFLFI